MAFQDAVSDTGNSAHELLYTDTAESGMISIAAGESDGTDTQETNTHISIPKDFVVKCVKCGKVLFKEELEESFQVCPKCGYHNRLTWEERIEMICDEGSFCEYFQNMASENPLNFPGYDDKKSVTNKKTDLNDGTVVGECEIDGISSLIGVMDVRYMMGSMGSVTGEKIARLFEIGADKELPVILFTASGGARMQEGIISLMQMAKTSGAVKKYSDLGNLYITVLTDPTTGGVTASFAMLGDIILAEPGSLIGFAGRRVIEDTIGETLPDNFQSAEFLLESGFVDNIVHRNELKSTLALLLNLHGYGESGTRQGGGRCNER